MQIYASAPQMSAYLIEALEGRFYYGKTLLPSVVYPIPVLGKPFRDLSGPVIFNELIYGDSDNVDQIIPLAGEPTSTSTWPGWFSAACCSVFSPGSRAGSWPPRPRWRATPGS